MTLNRHSHTLYAYDPGGTTGWASFLVHPTLQRAVLVDCGERELWTHIDIDIASAQCRAVVYENIIPRSVEFNPIGLQVIGVIRYLCEQYVVDVHSQPNAVLRGIERWGTYDLSKIKSPHARDAAMHGIVYLRKHGYDVALAQR